MKTITLFCLLIMIVGCTPKLMMGKKIDPAFRSMEKIIQVPQSSKDKLYIDANAWFVSTFTSAENVIEFQDKESGKIVGKYTSIHYEGLFLYRYRQTIEIDVKENRLKITISNPFYKIDTNTAGDYYLLDTQEGVLKARKEWANTIKGIEKYITEKKDW